MQETDKPRLKKQSPAKGHKLLRHYNETFKGSTEYLKSLPDIQNTTSSEIQGANVPIPQVGISNFRLPLKFLTKDADVITLEASITGTVSLGADIKGVNMSRLMRNFYKFKERIFTPELLEEILLDYKKDIKTSRGRLKIEFSYPIMKSSLRSENAGYQYYKVAYEGIIDDLDRFQKIIHFDFVYSSACPCSSELAEHAVDTRRVYSIPHSQRSKARVSVEICPGALCTIEDIQNHCLEALKTETQVMVKREDEQAFAELNGSFVKFVEDAARLVYEQLQSDERICDFQITCVHLESLHSHDVVAVITKGVHGGFTGEVDDFKSFIC